jgi:DNA-binding protein H-NS
MTINIEHLTIPELRDLQAKVEQQIKALDRKEREAAIEEIYSIAHRHGMTLKDLINKAPAGKKLGKVEVKYRNTEDPSQEWTGRGRQPKWVKEALEAGKTLESFRV